MEHRGGQQKMSDFLKSQDLFNRTYANSNFKRSVMYFGKQPASSRYPYHVPSDLLKYQTSEMTQKHRGEDFSPIKAEMEDKSVSNPQLSLQSSRIKTLGVHNQSWIQTLQQTKKKYFEVCRNQAQQFSNKLIGIINSDLEVLQVKIQEVRLTIKQHINEEKEQIKNKLYNMIDLALQKWARQQQANYKNKQFQYLGDLIQLQAIMQERVKSMASLKSNLQNDLSWRQVAGNLLSGYYQQDTSQLSQQCKQYVVTVSDQVNKMLQNRTDILKFQLLQYSETQQNFFKDLLFDKFQNIAEKSTRTTTTKYTPPPEQQIEKTYLSIND